jgi:hypothetical protein
MKTSIISGNFKATIEGEVNRDGQVNLGTEKEPKLVNAGQVIDECGITYIGQRDGLGSFYKGELKKGQKRNELEYSDEAGAKMAASLTESFAPYGDIKVTVDQHEPSEGGASPMVRATTFVESLLAGGQEAQLRAVLAVYDPSAATADQEGLIAIANKNGLGVQPPRKAKNGNA